MKSCCCYPILVVSFLRKGAPSAGELLKNGLPGTRGTRSGIWFGGEKRASIIFRWRKLNVLDANFMFSQNVRKLPKPFLFAKKYKIYPNWQIGSKTIFYMLFFELIIKQPTRAWGGSLRTFQTTPAPGQCSLRSWGIEALHCVRSQARRHGGGYYWHDSNRI